MYLSESVSMAMNRTASLEGSKVYIDCTEDKTHDERNHLAVAQGM